MVLRKAHFAERREVLGMGNMGVRCSVLGMSMKIPIVKKPFLRESSLLLANKLLQPLKSSQKQLLWASHPTYYVVERWT